MAAVLSHSSSKPCRFPPRSRSAVIDIGGDTLTVIALKLTAIQATSRAPAVSVSASGSPHSNALPPEAVTTWESSLTAPTQLGMPTLLVAAFPDDHL